MITRRASFLPTFLLLASPLCTRADESTENNERVQNLIKILSDKKESSHARYKAAIILGNLRAQDAVKPLIDALKDEKQAVIRGAAYALGKLKASEAVQPLIDLLNRQNTSRVNNVCEITAAIKALAEIGGKKAIAGLEKFLTDNDKPENFVFNQYVHDELREAIAGLKK